MRQIIIFITLLFLVSCLIIDEDEYGFEQRDSFTNQPLSKSFFVNEEWYLRNVSARLNKIKNCSRDNSYIFENAYSNALIFKDNRLFCDAEKEIALAYDLDSIN